MQREIKFRAKAVEEMASGNQWIEGYGIFKLELADGTSEWYLSNLYDDTRIISETVGQYTGLKDKNGKEIYEGDICGDSMGWTFKVIWDNENARFLGSQSKPRGNTNICYVGREPAVEIIGNVYDNPDLLKEESK